MLLIDTQPYTDLLQLGKRLVLLYGNQDVKLWREFEQALIRAEIEALGESDQINLAPAIGQTIDIQADERGIRY